MTFHYFEFNFGLNARYYKTGKKVDYAPYMRFNYSSFGYTVDVFNGMTTTSSDVESSQIDFTLGSGIHYKPADGVKVYNEFEFKLVLEMVLLISQNKHMKMLKNQSYK